MRLVSRLFPFAVLLASALPVWAEASDTFPAWPFKEKQIVNILGGRAASTKDGNRFGIMKGLSSQFTEAPLGCAGDCKGDGTVTVDEILTMVNIALGNAPVTDCSPGDADHSSTITVNEIITAVNNALNGCGGTGTPTPTPAPGCHADDECPASYPHCGPDGNCWTQPCSDVCSDGQGCCGGSYPFCGPDGNCWNQPCATLCGTTCCGPTQQCQVNGTCSSPQGTPTPTQTPQPSVTASPHLYCRTPSGGLPIPDDDPLGVEDTLTIAEALPITDAKVRLQITHSWVGDLVVTLHHVDSLSSVTLIDRPGVSSVDELGCERSNILCILDDAATAAVDDQCADTDPAIAGTLRPKDPLSTFNGESSAGDWILSVYDESPGDTGNLVSWCLEVNTAPPAGISVTVSPTTTSLGQGGTQQFTATVTGTTNTAVTWSVLEGAPGGTITSDGLYTAPSAPGTFHPMAESQADPSQNGIATVVVTGTCSGGVSVTPATVSLGLQKLQHFTSSAGTSAIWSVQEGPDGGQVSSEGDYAAPRKAGTYHVLARNADLTSCGSATVTVVDDTQISETRSASVGPAGGVVVLPSGPALEIPAGAAASPVTATLSLIGNDPDFGDQNHLVLDVSLSGDVSSAFLKIPVPAGRNANDWGAARIDLDSLQAILLSGAVTQAGTLYTVDLMEGPGTPIRSGRYAVESYDGGASPLRQPATVVLPTNTIFAPYFEQYAVESCWAASSLSFITTYRADARGYYGIYMLLEWLQQPKNNALLDLWDWNTALLAYKLEQLTGKSITRIAYFWFRSFKHAVISEIDSGHPVLAFLKVHAGLFVGYEVADDGSVSLIYHDPEDPTDSSAPPRFPYRKITDEELRSEFWDKNNYWARIFVADERPDTSPVLQTIHMPDKLPGQLPQVLKFKQGIGLARGAVMVDSVTWDHTQPTGYRHEAGGKALSEVPSDFTDILIQDVPVWNADPTSAASVTIQTTINAKARLFSLWQKRTPASVPAFDPAAPRNSRYSYSLKIPAAEFVDKLLPTDSQFTLLVELLDANDTRLGYFDVVFPIHPSGANSASFQRTWTDYVTDPVGGAFAYTNDFSVTISGQFKSAEEIVSTTAIPKHSLLVHAPTSDLQISGSASATFNVPSRVDNGDFYYLITPVGETTYRLDLGCGSVDQSSGAFTALLTTQCPEIYVSADATFHFEGYEKADNSKAGSPFDQPYYPILLDIQTAPE